MYRQNRQVYLASGWFTQEQIDARDDILEVLRELDLRAKTYSPLEDADKQTGDINDPAVRKAIFDSNESAMLNAHIAIVSTIGKDMGTIFEAGWFNRNSTDIVYYAPGFKGKFNLMLSESAASIATSKQELTEVLMGWAKSGKVLPLNLDSGDLDYE